MVWVMARWCFFTLTFTCVMVIVLSIATLLDITAVAITRRVVEVLVFRAGQIFTTATATRLFVEVLVRWALVKLTDTLA